MDEIIDSLANLAYAMYQMKRSRLTAIVHYIVMCHLFRACDEFESDREFTRKHIFGSWFCSLLLCFSGNIMFSFLVGEPVIYQFKNYEDVLFVTAVWYLINFCSCDLVFNLLDATPVKLIIKSIWYIYTLQQIEIGIDYGKKHYPDNLHIIALLGTAKAVGHVYMKVLIKCLKGTFQHEDNVALYWSTFTKRCFVCSCFLTLSANEYIELGSSDVRFILVLLLFLAIGSVEFSLLRKETYINLDDRSAHSDTRTSIFRHFFKTSSV